MSPEIAQIARIQELFRSHLYCVWFGYCPQCGELCIFNKCQGEGEMAAAYLSLVDGSLTLGPFTLCEPCGVLVPAVPISGDPRVH